VPHACKVLSARGLSTGGGNDEDDDEDDEFTSISTFDPAAAQAESDAADAAARALADAPSDITPDMASALVTRMVEAATAAAGGGATAAGVAVPRPPPMTAHTLSVVRAARITTHSVIAAAGSKHRYPISAKVTARVDIGLLRLSRLARAALEEIAGPRLVGNILTINVQKYATSAENEAHAVAVMGRALAEARLAVGETIDDAPLDSWDGVIAAVKQQTARDSEEVRAMVDYLRAGSTTPGPHAPPSNDSLPDGTAGAVATETDPPTDSGRGVFLSSSS
jgi:Mitochondrial ribosomal subunit protein